MFHLVTYNSINRNIPLEELKNRRDRVPKSSVLTPGRKTFLDTLKESKESGAGPLHSKAVEAYKKQSENSAKTLLLHARDIMNSPVFTINIKALPRDAWKTMKEKNISHLPVIDNKSMIQGIVSDRDIMRGAIIDDDKIISNVALSLKDIMATEVITADPLTDIRRIAKAMFDNHISTMPIISENNDLAGIITRSDILHALIHYPDLQLWA